MMVADVRAMPMAAMVMMVPMVMLVTVMAVSAALLARRDDGGHRAEHRDHGGGGSRVIVAVIVATAGAGRQGRSSQCNRGRSSNSDCAAGHNTHFDFSSLMLSPHWGSTSI
jgi:hypothetical protein